MSDHEIYRRFPFFVDIHGWEILVVGGGSIAARRVKVLADFGPRITVAAPSLQPTLAEAAEKGGIRWEAGPFCPELLDRKRWNLVLIATDDHELNRQVSDLCRDRSIPRNNASDQQDCDFFFPAIVEGQGMIMGLVSDGRDHRHVREIAARIREEYGE